MPEYSDVYVISGKRDRVTIDAFLDRFLPNREESADEYEYPQYADEPETTYESASGILARCIEDKTAEYVVYWRAAGDSKPEHAMVFLLRDGNVIYGLSTDASDRAYARQLLAELKDLLGSRLGYVAHEASPDVRNLHEFELQVEAHDS